MTAKKRCDFSEIMSLFGGKQPKGVRAQKLEREYTSKQLSAAPQGEWTTESCRNELRLIYNRVIKSRAGFVTLSNNNAVTKGFLM